MKKLYLIVSLTLVGLMVYLWIGYNGLIMQKIVFIVSTILLLSTAFNYMEWKAIVNEANKE